jgi:hypothetical protein
VLDDLGELLAYQQHHGLPTRLMDWTEAPLVALYFAVWDDNHWEEDGAVWCLSPGELNRQMMNTIPGTVGWDIARAHGLMELGTKTPLIAAVRGQHREVRHIVQIAQYTLHGSEMPLQDYEKSSDFLAVIRIPAASKADICGSLRQLGINRGTLFPDVDNIARDIVDSLKANIADRESVPK